MADDPIDWRTLTLRPRTIPAIYERVRGKLTVLTHRRRKGAPKFNAEQIEFMGRDFYEARLAAYYTQEGDVLVAPSIAALARATYVGKGYAAAANEIKDVRQSMAIALAQAGEPVLDIVLASGVNTKTLREAWFVGDEPTGEEKVANQKELDEDETGEVKPVMAPVLEKSLLVPKAVMVALEGITVEDQKARGKTFHPFEADESTTSEEEDDEGAGDELDALGDDALEEEGELAAAF